MQYPVILRPDDNGTILVTSPDLPVVTYGADREEALWNAVDAFVVLIESYRKDGQPTPPPSPITGPYVDVPGL